MMMMSLWMGSKIRWGICGVEDAAVKQSMIVWESSKDEKRVGMLSLNSSWLGWFRKNSLHVVGLNVVVSIVDF